MKGYEGLALALIAEGVEVVFGVLAGDNDLLIHHLTTATSVRFIACRHEQAAVTMADGYSRVTGKVGVATVTMGPGLTNAGTSLTIARHSRSRLVVICGDKPPGSRFGNMDMDQPPFIMATAGAMQSANAPEAFAAEVQLAFRRATMQRTPVVLVAPGQMMAADLAEGWRYNPSSKVIPQRQAPSADPALLEKLSEMLSEARRPAILAGRGAVESGAGKALSTLADMTGAVLTTSLLAKGLFAGHPRDAGVSGGFIHPGARRVLEQADLLVAFGASLNPWTMDKGKLYPDARRVLVSLEAEVLGDTVPLDLSLMGDARATADVLVELLRGANAQGWDPSVTERLAAVDPFEDVTFFNEEGFASRHRTVETANRLLPKDRVVVVGAGHFMAAPACYMAVDDPRKLVLPWRMGAVGAAVPAGIGAACAPGAPLTVLFDGDGGLMMSLGDFETGGRYGLKFLAIVFDDGGFGADRIVLRERGLKDSIADYDNPDFETIARAFGYVSYTADSDEAFESILAGCLPITAPTFINVKISRDDIDLRLNRALGLA